MKKNSIIMTASLLWFCYDITNSEVYFYELYLHNEVLEVGSTARRSTGYTSVTGTHYNLAERTENRLSWNGVGSLKFGYHHAWIECIGGVGKEWVTARTAVKTTKKEHGGLDDFLIDCGYNFFYHDKKGQLIVHFLTGFPLQSTVLEEDVLEPLVGSRTINLGPVVECAYSFIREHYQELFFNIIIRFLHQFSRHYFPIYPCDSRLHPGNTTDTLFLIHYRRASHELECGYNATFLTNQYLASNQNKESFKNAHFSLFYGYYAYSFHTIPLTIEIGTAYSFNNYFSQWKGWALASLNF